MGRRTGRKHGGRKHGGRPAEDKRGTPSCFGIRSYTMATAVFTDLPAPALGAIVRAVAPADAVALACTRKELRWLAAEAREAKARAVAAAIEALLADFRSVYAEVVAWLANPRSWVRGCDDTFAVGPWTGALHLCLGADADIFDQRPDSPLTLSAHLSREVTGDAAEQLGIDGCSLTVIATTERPDPAAAHPAWTGRWTLVGAGAGVDGGVDAAGEADSDSDGDESGDDGFWLRYDSAPGRRDRLPAFPDELSAPHAPGHPVPDAALPTAWTTQVDVGMTRRWMHRAFLMAMPDIKSYSGKLPRDEMRSAAMRREFEEFLGALG